MSASAPWTVSSSLKLFIGREAWTAIFVKKFGCTHFYKKYKSNFVQAVFN
ncbi:MAG: hypothetical protein ACKPKO_22305 [Candidatus Fonsibacter sp.]